MISTNFGSLLELKTNLQTATKLINQKPSDFSTRINKRNPSSNWYSSIRIHVSNGSPKEALLIYAQNRGNPLCLLSVIPLVLKACASLSMIKFGKALHSESIKGGVESDVVVGTSIVNMYGKCCEVVDARKVFDEMPVKNVVTWNAMIGGYMRNGITKRALCLFEKMPCRTTVSWIEMIEGYARTGDTKMGRWIFDQVPLALRNVVTWTVMVEGYASNGEMKAAKDVFEAMPQRNFFVYSSMISGYFQNGHVEEGKAFFDTIKVRNLVNWNSLISGYCQNGLCEEALDAFARMQADGFEPDEVSFASALSACAQLGSLETGMLEKNDACWNAMISGFSIHGHCKEALEFFDRMVKSSVNPNEITFLSVLTACAHSGFVQEGLETFSKMEKYGLSPNIKHYGCLVDLLGRAGRLKDAYRIVTEMPMRPNDMIWVALLGACRVHADMDMANQVLEKVRDQEYGDGSHYVLMSNIYAASERWEKAESVRIVMSRKRVSKTIGHSSVTLENT